MYQKLIYFALFYLSDPGLMRWAIGLWIAVFLPCKMTHDDLWTQLQSGQHCYYTDHQLRSYYTELFQAQI